MFTKAKTYNLRIMIFEKYSNEIKKNISHLIIVPFLKTRFFASFASNLKSVRKHIEGSVEKIICFCRQLFESDYLVPNAEVLVYNPDFSFKKAAFRDNVSTNLFNDSVNGIIITTGIGTGKFRIQLFFIEHCITCINHYHSVLSAFVLSAIRKFLNIVISEITSISGIISRRTRIITRIKRIASGIHSTTAKQTAIHIALIN